MKRPHPVWLFALCGAALMGGCERRDPPPDERGASSPREGGCPPGRIPPAFVENRGQLDGRARFMLAAGSHPCFLEERGWTVVLPAVSPAGVAGEAGLRLSFRGASAAAVLRPEGRLPGAHHFLLGRDPGRWRAGIPGYAAVRYESLYPGIDLVARSAAGALEWDLLLQPGSDLSLVRVEVEGAEELAVAAGGALALRTRAGELRQPAPTTWEIGPDGRRARLCCSHVLLGRTGFGFAVPAWTGERPLVVDPGFTLATLLGATGKEEPKAVHVDGAGAVTLGGTTRSTQFPVSTGALQTTMNASTSYGTGFVTRLDSTYSRLLFSTYIGGSAYDFVYGLAVDGQGQTTLTGSTSSGDFPVTPGAFQTVSNKLPDVFVARLDATGGKLLFSTFLGGSMNESGWSLALAAGGETVVAGGTQSSDFPVTPGAFQTIWLGTKYKNDVFVSRLDASGSALLASTFVGGTSDDSLPQIRLDAGGEPWVYCCTSSKDFPVTPDAYATTHPGTTGTALFGLDAALGKLRHATFFGGSGQDYPGGLALEPGGRIVLAGTTGSPDLPVTNQAWQRKLQGDADAFLAVLDWRSRSLVYSTYLGGTQYDRADAVALGPGGILAVGGSTKSLDFPVTPHAPQYYRGGMADGFAAVLDPARGILLLSTLLAAAGDDSVTALTVDGGGEIVACGYTTGSGFPFTLGTYSATNAGETDLFVARFPPESRGVRRFGAGTPACGEEPLLYVTADPKAGERLFGFECWRTPPDAAGLLLLALGDLPQGPQLLGIRLWLDPALLVVLPALSNWRRVGACLLPLPVGTRGSRLFGQFVWANPPSCPGGGPLSASDALEITVQ